MSKAAIIIIDAILFIAIIFDAIAWRRAVISLIRGAETHDDEIKLLAERYRDLDDTDNGRNSTHTRRR